MNRITRVRVLLVEDNPDHAEFAERALARNGDAAVTWVKNGEDAIAFLCHEGTWAAYQGPLPSLIVLDLSLPKLDGHGVLQRVKHDDRLRQIPVVVLSTSSNANDIASSYRLGANSYVVKSGDFGRLEAIRDYWFDVNVGCGQQLAEA